MHLLFSNLRSFRARTRHVRPMQILRSHALNSFALALVGLVVMQGLVFALQTEEKGDKTAIESDIGYSTMGNILQSNRKNSVVLIKQQESGKIRALKEGDKILEYTIEEIHAKYLKLSKKNESLLVYQDKFAGESQSPTPAPKPKLPTGLAYKDAYSEPGFERKSGAITMSEDYREKIVKQDLSKILMQATAEPHFTDGRIAGFKLSQIDEDSIYAKGGLRNDDIITEINGKRLGNVAGAIRLLQSLRSAEFIEIELLRDGQPDRITLSVK